MSSHEFDNAFCDNTGSCVVCEFCGTTEFTQNAERWDVYLENSKSDPKFKPNYTDGSIGFGVIDGKQYIYQCDCGKVDKIEEWIWRHREQIANYLVARARNEAVEASETLANMLPLTDVQLD